MDISSLGITGVAAITIICLLIGQGVTLGTGDGSTFSPDTVCQRGQIVTFLYRAANAAA